jgi:hypothetical protein
MKTMFALGVALTVAATAFGQNGLVPLKDVPKEARKAADRAAPGVKWLLANKDQAGGYMLLGKDAKKQTVEFLTDAKGEKYAVRVEVPLNGVPAGVTNALRKELPTFKPKSVQACGVDTKKTTVYRFQGEGYQGGNAGVYVSASGKKVALFKD